MMMFTLKAGGLIALDVWWRDGRGIRWRWRLGSRFWIALGSGHWDEFEIWATVYIVKSFSFWFFEVIYREKGGGFGKGS